MMATARREENKQEVADTNDPLQNIDHFLRLQKWLKNSAVKLLAFALVFAYKEALNTTTSEVLTMQTIWFDR